MTTCERCGTVGAHFCRPPAALKAAWATNDALRAELAEYRDPQHIGEPPMSISQAENVSHAEVVISPIVCALDDQEKQIERLAGLVVYLDERTSPVQNPNREEGSDEDRSPGPLRSQVAARIHQQTDAIRYQSDRLERIIRDLEV